MAGSPAPPDRGLARPRRVPAAPLHGAHADDDEDARAALQDRLAVFAKALFWSFVGLVVFLFVLYTNYSDIEPQHQNVVYAVASIALALLAIVWRILLVRRSLTVDQLYGLDLFIMVGSGASFGTVAPVTWDLRASAYTCLIYQLFTVFTRALVVPSSGRRTAIASALSFLPLVIGAIVLVNVATPEKKELPGVAFVGGAVLYAAVAVLLATTGSRIIYGLRREVREAMQLGMYTLDRKIGSGGMGAVYHARHKLLRRPTAVKLLLPELVGGADNLDRFEKEVQLMSQLTHPNTVAIFDYGRNPDGVLYYAMEYLGGIDLDQLVKRFGRQPAGRVVHILQQVCGALQEAHDANLIHRDIKPANIILCERGGMPDVAKVVDFGLVKEITRDTGASTQLIMGTPGYIAPEAIEDPDAVGPAVDQYALGAVGYFLLTGKLVFEGKTAVDICIQHVTKEPTPPSQLGVAVPPELEAVILRCLAKQPRDRHRSAAAMADALAAVPAARDWNNEEARRWWHDFHAAEVAPSPTDMPTITMQIDIAQREAS